ncbi:bacteriocin [Zobellella taiwanensis]|uniref:Bacteriocin n=1 Tax=Zobellella taiwanensis TaxID=347535 RepID=A0A2P7R590_9GAMM|nr:bacteriocin [Zobellella taiwanensis]PSJ45390.1 bacteriocin [Zobellella taiwanensis]
MGYGILDIGAQTRQQALDGLRQADEAAQQRELMNKQMKEQQKAMTKQNQMSMAGLGAATGMMAGMGSAAMGAKFGAAAGPVGMAAGAAIGLIAGGLF